MKDNLINILASSDLEGSKLFLLVFGIIAICLVLFFFVVFLALRFTEKQRYVNICGKRVYRIAMDLDYYLVNDFSFPTDEASFVVINHILFGPRYIYIINDQYYRGVLEGEHEDLSWMFYPKGREEDKQIIKNPILQNRKRIEKLVLLTGIDKNFFVSVVLFNNECYIDDIKTKSRNEYISSVKQLSNLIEAVEKRPIEKMDPLALERAVQDIARLRNQFKKRGQ